MRLSIVLFFIISSLLVLNSCGGSKNTNGGNTTSTDTDHDGIPDSSDNCPNTPSNVSVDSNGCPITTTTTEVLLRFKLNLDSNEETVDEISGKSISIVTESNKNAEAITGVSGEALRVNGFYGWAQGDISGISYPTKSFTVMGWVAPQTFPVQRKDQDSAEEETIAAIFTNASATSSSGISFGINHHGKVIAQFKVGSEIHTFKSEAEITLNEWTHIALSVNASNGTSSIFINGSLNKNYPFSSGDLSWSVNSTIYIGRGVKPKTLAGYITNGLNGAIDEVEFYNTGLDASEIHDNYKKFTPSSPDLSIPSERFSGDSHRPKYHPMPAYAWTNEPHGIYYLDGKYHLFYQKNGNGPYWNHINWGHLISTNLLNWEETTVALWPQQNPGFDITGIWSGHSIVHDGIPYLFYTGVDKAKAGIGLATTSDGISFNKSTKNPIINMAPTSIAHADFRDPYVFNEGGRWYMIIGTGVRSGAARGGVFLYESTSTDFTEWSYKGLFYDATVGDFWEMPLYHNFGSQSILLVHKLPNAASQYWVGSMGNNRFNPNTGLKNLDPINHLLSPSLFIDAGGKETAIGIIPDELGTNAKHIKGYAHYFSLPREWNLINSEILQKPHNSLIALRGDKLSYTNVNFNGSFGNKLPNAQGKHVEIVATIDKGTAYKVGFDIFKNGDNNQYTRIYYDYSLQRFGVERSNSTSLNEAPTSDKYGNATIPGSITNWRIFLDGSILEVFVNDKFAFACVAFSDDNSDLIDVFSEGGTASASTIDIYQISNNSIGKSSKSSFQSKQPRSSLKVYPNPSRSIFNIEYNVRNSSMGLVFIFDMLGKKVAQIIAPVDPINNRLIWNGFLENGQKAPIGVYLAKGIIDGQIVEAKLLVN